MPGWLLRSERVRAFELLAEFLQLGARAASPEEGFHPACDLLRRLWEADGVLLWKLDADARRLLPLAASALEWEFFGELSVEVFPELARALNESAPVWVEGVRERRPSLPPPLGDAASLLALPVTAGGRARGCLFGLFGKGAAPPAGEEREAGLAVAAGIGWWLAAMSLEERSQRLARRQETRRRVETAVVRAALAGSALERLAAALRELSEAEAVGFYERRATTLRRVAAAGAVEHLPRELPWSETEGFPWQRALAGGAPLTLAPAEVSSAWDTWWPRLAGSHLSLSFLPLPAGGAFPGLAAVLGPAAGEGNAEAESLLCWLAGQELDRARLERWGEELARCQQAVFEQAAEGLFFADTGGALLSANPALLCWTGYERSDLERRPLAEFLSPEEAESLSAWLRGGCPGTFQSSVRWREKSGSWRELDVHLQPLPPPAAPAPPGAEPAALLLGRVRDLADERRVETRLRSSEARWQGLLDSVHEGVWVIGADGRIEFANHRLSQLFGVKPQQLASGLAQAEAVDALRQQLAAPEQALGQWEHLAAHPDQVCWDELELLLPRRRVLERFARPLFDARHQVVGRLEVYRDITPQRVLEDKVLQREKLAALGQLVSGIAHELNNPLTAVSGHAQLLLGASLPPALHEKARLLVREAERAGRVVQNLLLFAREAKAQKQPVDLNDLLERTLSLRAYELRVANIQVAREHQGEKARVWGDPHQLQQVFLNLLLNAEQAIRSQREQGRIDVRVRALPGGELFEVEVADNGPGIPAAILPHIFEPFFTTKPPREGTGLGLSISESIVKEHGGEILVRSTAGEGATFIVRLPVHEPSARPAGLPEGPPAARTRPKAARRILVVDDEPAVAQLLADALAQQGFEVRAHTESRRALAEAFEQPFDLAICDVRMPDVDGPAFYRALRDRQSALARRLLFTTGDTLARQTAEFLAEVRLPCLAKPFRLDELRARVQELLEESEKTSRERDTAAGTST